MTADKQAKRAARELAAAENLSYTAARRRLTEPGDPEPLPPHLNLLDIDTLDADERLAAEGLRDLAAQGRALPVREAPAETEAARALAQAQAAGRRPRWQRWASVQAAADGYVVREVLYGPNRSGYSSSRRGPRVPVPVPTPQGGVAVVAMPEWARLYEGRWIWAHTGWPLDAPGRIVDPPQEPAPAPGLRWQVAVWLDLGRDGREEKQKVLGEDYAGGTSNWQTEGWCTSRADARLIARAHTAYRHRDHYARADVLEHPEDRGGPARTVDTFVPKPGAPERPRPARPAGQRPDAADSEVAEPAWFPDVVHPPTSSLQVWTGSAWHTLVWADTTGMIAQVLGIGAGGPYAWATAWGPCHPDRGLHDWTQEGREPRGLFPEPDAEERAARATAARRGAEEALVAAIADRGRLSREQAQARLAQGGKAYRRFLDAGQAAVARALHTARRALPAGPERTALRHALDGLHRDHLLPEGAARLATEQLDREGYERGRAMARPRRALAEYLAPAPDPTAAGVEGFGPQETIGS